jgi:hypothetical protein
VQLTPSVESSCQAACDAAEIPFDPHDPESALEQLGPFARMIGATLRHTANPTMLQAGYKSNVIPGEAEAVVDARFLPGLEKDFFEQFDALLDEGVTYEARCSTSACPHPSRATCRQDDRGAGIAEDPRCGACPVHAVGRHGRQGAVPLGHPMLRVRTTADCPPTSTSRHCSTASMSGCPLSRWSSGFGCSTGSCARHDGPPATTGGDRAESGGETRALALLALGSIGAGPATPRRALRPRLLRDRHADPEALLSDLSWLGQPVQWSHRDTPDGCKALVDGLFHEFAVFPPDRFPGWLSSQASSSGYEKASTPPRWCRSVPQRHDDGWLRREILSNLYVGTAPLVARGAAGGDAHGAGAGVGQPPRLHGNRRSRSPRPDGPRGGGCHSRCSREVTAPRPPRQP